MPLHHSRSWSDAIHRLRNDCPPPAVRMAYIASVNEAKAEANRAQAGARFRTTAGGFDRRALMAYAVANARCERLNRPARTWQACMAEALTFAWACAHAARRAESH
ncbi:hypothetical protein PMNALOAF_4113 [Methylobacterium adhaesivum]|uniref:Uncharacterized protein n=1 Tax=Methylobacterium adhaesivum TaxID=333297 RepID=A0ABT8BMN6_9HYPH|nr:hypothetical protein [Methylobacterium adhaesivum]MDN3592493.1 hypothetical protein [Methylobacterium adhaesivum]GJD32834.1 hypothetical protein PMNALOAF_4113 [Methylobacterium adhaesivum]